MGFFWWFFKVEHIESPAKLWKIIKYAKNLYKKMKKSIVQLALKPIFWLISGMYLICHYARAYDIFFNGLILRQNGKSQSPLICIFNHACNWQKHFSFVVDVDQKLTQQLWRFEINYVKHLYISTDVPLSFLYSKKWQILRVVTDLICTDQITFLPILIWS